MRTYIHVGIIHTCGHTYMRAYIHVGTNAGIYTCGHSYIRAGIIHEGIYT